MADMTGQVAVVTGGARGIGKAISERLANRGCKVAVGYSNGRDAAAELAEKYPGMTIHQGNIGNREDCERVVQEVYDQHGRIDILVNNAGITADKMLHKMTVEDWDKVVQVNLSGTFYMSHLAFQHMRERGSGRIVSISSVIGERGNAGQANYAATKSGLFGLTMSLASEGAKKGVTANCVAPGYIETDMVAGVPESALEKIVAQVPVGRLGQPDEVARVVEFLADPDSGYITGQVYSVNGGLFMSS
ncbi:beta-ketoacyl-ACP reductase [Actinomycetospora corticicola]|uniref:NAD(P)-dependent dehydrogenase (Short-subunit alcohol dehydrogenase family) n=1 Tax=Actinomycetospora corticicola TaxID=663602 RepID=A0A7Y9DXI5_9PSEU|nr:beta-ketoacyl-ACP reductase [Actinomycetospora corticicola]NYD37244.1 NAD(P)-dependent dehydrogenase (short-subunit alcohol dehydrogenase family) [Actinomycetospora corticicola]